MKKGWPILASQMRLIIAALAVAHVPATYVQCDNNCMYNKLNCGRETCTQAELNRATAFKFLLGWGIWNKDGAGCSNFQMHGVLTGLGVVNEKEIRHSFTYNSHQCEVKKTATCMNIDDEALCAYTHEDFQGDEECTKNGLTTCLEGLAMVPKDSTKRSYRMLLGPNIYNTESSACTDFKDITKGKSLQQLLQQPQSSITRRYEFKYNSVKCTATKTASCSQKSNEASCSYSLKTDKSSCKTATAACMRA